jgi:hypothetical protein
MRIRLIRKLAKHINGVDVSHRRVGEVMDLPPRDAELLLAEGWARPVPDSGHESSRSARLKPSSRRPNQPRE